MPNNKSIYYLSVQTKTALHIGTTAGANDVSDSLFRRNSQGHLVLPGTSIAGAIRSHLTRLAPAMTGLAPHHICDALSGKEKQDEQQDKGSLRSLSVNDALSGTEEQVKPLACGCIICHLMGDIRPLNEIRDPKLPLDKLERLNGRASRLIVHDALIEKAEQTHIRDGVGIDRTTGASARAASAKFDFETIPAGAEFEIVLELEDADDIDRYLLNLALYEWQEGRLRFGGNKSRGTGVLMLKGVERTSFDLSKPDHADLMRFLRRNIQGQKPTRVKHTEYKDKPPHRNYHNGYSYVPGSVQSWLTIDFDLQAQGFFLTNDTTQATAKGYDHKSLLFLPGASLRGAIRSQAERIARTLVNLRVDNEDDFLKHCPAPNPFVTRGDRQNGIESSAARIRQQAPDKRTDAESYDLAEQLFGSVDWGSRLAVEDAPLAGEPTWKKLDFVAIDRFTGGAADGAKFDAYALWQPRFRCRLHLEAPQSWEIGWLLYVLKDLIDGRVPVGFGAAKGFGDVLLENLQLTLGYVYPEAAPLNGLPSDGDTFFLKKSFTGWAEVSQTGWLEAWNTMLEGYEVAIPHTQSHDPYWNTPINQLYRKETAVHDLLK
jgi:CRISPR/Cas system CSM-associated protein Csm3 (group 7 of RAMP superfamily)